MLQVLLLIMLSTHACLTAGDQKQLSKQLYTKHLRGPASVGTRLPSTIMPRASRSEKNRLRKELELNALTQEPGSEEQIRKIADLLEKQKVNPNMPTALRFGARIEGSPLCNASFRGNLRVAHLLANFGADVNALCHVKSKMGDRMRRIAVTPLISAARGHKRLNDYEGFYPETIAMLAEFGARINDGGTKELPFTALHSLVLASRRCPLLTVAKFTTLSALKADLFQKTFYGWTAQELARKKIGNIDFANLLYYAENHFLRQQALDQTKEQPKKASLIKKKKSRSRRKFVRLKGSSHEVLESVDNILLP